MLAPTYSTPRFQTWGEIPEPNGEQSMFECRMVNLGMAQNHQPPEREQKLCGSTGYQCLNMLEPYKFATVVCPKMSYPKNARVTPKYCW